MNFNELFRSNGSIIQGTLSVNGYSREDYKELGFNFPSRFEREYPYNFDSYIIWTNKKKSTESAYHDRMAEQDRNKYFKLRKKYNVYFWNEKNIENIEKFLREYFNKPYLELTTLLKCCDHSSGYPVWYVEFISEPSLKKKN